MTTNNGRGGGSGLAVYYADFAAKVTAIRAAASAIDPITGRPDDGALIVALGLNFDVWDADLLDDAQAEVGVLQPGVPVPARWEDAA